jgi:hypothetical protein
MARKNHASEQYFDCDCCFDSKNILEAEKDLSQAKEKRVDDRLEHTILKKMELAGWTTTRALLDDPSEDPSEEEVRRIESAMANLSNKGLVTLWRLVPDSGAGELMAAVRPGFELDKDLEQRGAWAKAYRLQTDE